VIAAEDARYSHPAWTVAMGSAATGAALPGRPLTGASTLTQQLARVLEKAPRTRRAKLDVMGLAVRIEMELPKDRILEAYLNEIEFGAKLRGAEAASWALFDKPARELSLAEVAALASIPRGTSLYDPIKHPENLRRRRDRVLDRMAAHGLATADEARAAKGDPLVLAPRLAGVSAPHFARCLDQRLGTALPPMPWSSDDAWWGSCSEARDLGPDHRRHAGRTRRHRGGRCRARQQERSRARLCRLPDAYDEAPRQGTRGGALRQPGSTLKPFVYELAFERLGMTPATLLPDIELSFPTASGDPYRPHNYDERFHGPVLVRQALGNSYNVPAVWVTERLGAENLLDRLHALGFLSLDRPASEYGLALALGDGEVTLLELASAYATLARGGEYLAPTSIAGWQLANGDFVTTATGSPKRVLSEASAALISDILRDKRARAASFGDETVFDLPFDVAAKTGTSKGFRDNFAVGFTSEVTVAVWVGSFDGGAMRGVSGICGPLFRGRSALLRVSSAAQAVRRRGRRRSARSGARGAALRRHKRSGCPAAGSPERHVEVGSTR
jgi:penicillin-binding protein 1C